MKVIDDLSTGRIANLHEAVQHGQLDTDIRVCDIRTQDCADTPVNTSTITGQPTRLRA